MLFDKTILLADDNAVTSDAAGTVDSAAKVIQAGGDDYSTMWVAAVVTTALAGAGNVDVILQTSDAADFSSGVVALHTVTLNATNGVKGAVFAYRLPLGLKKYTRVYFDVTGTLTAGKATVGLTDGIWAK